MGLYTRGGVLCRPAHVLSRVEFHLLYTTRRRRSLRLLEQCGRPTPLEPDKEQEARIFTWREAVAVRAFLSFDCRPGPALVALGELLLLCELSP